MSAPATRPDPPVAAEGTTPRPPWIVWFGLAVVLAAAAVLSFDALRALAVAVSIPDRFAWLLPIAVDAGAAVSCATWLGGRTTRDAARFAGRMTWCLLAVTVIGNAAQLGMAAHDILPPWYVAVLVGSIPPAVVGATVHLVVLLVRRPVPVRTAQTVQTVQTAQPTETTDNDEQVVEADVGALHDELLPAVRAWLDQQPGTPSQRQLRAEFGVGAERARRLMEAAA